MGTGQFIVRPHNGSAITCTMKDLSASPYLINWGDGLDWKEAEREELVYSDGQQGRVIGATHKTVGAQIQVWICGNTQEALYANLRVLQRAFRDSDGGIIQYRPVLFDDTVQSTYYHYLRSAPPRLVRESGAIGEDDGDTYGFANLYEFTVQIKPWATSDISSPVNLVPAKLVGNRYESGVVENYIVVPDNAFSGADIAWPVLNMVYTTGSSAHIGQFITNIRSYRGAESHREWVEADATTIPSSTEVTSAFHSDGTARKGTTNPFSMSIRYNVNTLDLSYLGKNLVVVAAQVVTADSEWTGTMANLVGGNLSLLGTALLSDDLVGEISPWSFSDAFTRVFTFPVINIPPYPLPSNVSDADIANYMSTGLLLIRFDRLVEYLSGELVIDWVAVLKADEFVAKFVPPSPDGGLSYINVGDYIVVNAYDQTAIAYDNDGGEPLVHYAKTGSPYANYYFKPGFNYAMNFIYINGRDFYIATETFTITVDAILGTIYPFETEA